MGSGMVEKRPTGHRGAFGAKGGEVKTKEEFLAILEGLSMVVWAPHAEGADPLLCELNDIGLEDACYMELEEEFPNTRGEKPNAPGLWVGTFRDGLFEWRRATVEECNGVKPWA